MLQRLKGVTDAQCDAARAKMGDTNGFSAYANIWRAEFDPRIEKIEGEGCDPGRVFIHLTPGFWFGPYEATHCMTVGSLKELRYALSLILNQGDSDANN
jgi:hypothetical protein